MTFVYVQGLATEALRLMMDYGTAELGITRYVAKILARNDTSLDLFRNKLGFRAYEVIECFGEIHLEYLLPSHVRKHKQPEQHGQHGQEIQGKEAAVTEEDRIKQKEADALTPFLEPYLGQKEVC